MERSLEANLDLPKRAEHDYMKALLSQVARPPADDPYISAYCRASFIAWEAIPEWRSIVSRFITSRHMTPANTVNQPLRALQRGFMNDNGSYPKNFDVETPWLDRMSLIANLDSDHPLRRQFENDINNKNVQSNISERYIAPAMLMGAVATRAEVSFLDIGCSQNLGAKRLAMRHFLHPFERIEVKTSKSDGNGRKRISHDDKSSFIARGWLKRSPNISYALGIDIMDPNDSDNAEWARACSFYPIELGTDVQDQYDLLSMMNPDNVAFMQADVTTLDPASIDKQFDFINFSAILHQLTPRGRLQAIENVRPFLKTGGYLIVSDWCSSNFRFVKNMHARDFTYRTHAARADEDAFREIFVFKNARSKIMQPGKDFDSLPVAT